MARAEDTGKDTLQPNQSGPSASDKYENEREPMSLAEQIVREGKAKNKSDQDQYEKIKQAESSDYIFDFNRWTKLRELPDELYRADKSP